MTLYNEVGVTCSHLIQQLVFGVMTVGYHANTVEPPLSGQ